MCNRTDMRTFGRSAANGWFEPSLTDAVRMTNGWYQTCGAAFSFIFWTNRSTSITARW